MKLFSAISFALTLAMTTAELSFEPQQSKRSLGIRGIRGTNLNGLWGQFHQDGMCIQKIEDADDDTSDKVKFMPCDPKIEAQMWQFTKVDPNPAHAYGGMLCNMEGRCLAIRGDVVEGRNLKVLECDNNNPKQHWFSDGDSTTPRDNKDLCITPESHPIKNRDPVVLLECEKTFSLDY